MNFQTTLQHLFAQQKRVVFAALLAGLSLLAFSGSAQAQTCSANMDFGDPGSPRYISSGAGVAFQGFLKGNLFGRVKAGRLTDLDLRLDPDVNGPNGLRLMTIGYNASPAVSAPRFRCRAITNGVKITISRVPTAREYFQNDSTVSIGYATLEITFERSGPGRLIARYQHSAFSRADSTPPKPHNGTVADAVPQAGARLTITNR